MKKLKLFVTTITVLTGLAVTTPSYAINGDQEFNGVSVFQAWVRSLVAGFYSTGNIKDDMFDSTEG